MQRVPHILINTAHIELWPARLLRARSSRDMRAIAQSTVVLRRKRDGAYLATNLQGGLFPLRTRLMQEPGIHDAIDALEHAKSAASVRGRPPFDGELPLQDLRGQLDTSGIDGLSYERQTGLTPVAEPAALALAGRDRYHRPLWLRSDAARAWERMQRAARCDHVRLDAISGYRSHCYQAGIVARKRASGASLDTILRVNAAPGYSEHHSGRALDIGTAGEPAAEASFEATVAFAWLGNNALRHGFTMSYPRDNPHGIVFEPWHWAYHST